MSVQGFLAADEDAGLRLDVALVSRGVAASRSQAQALVAAGRVTVDGRARRASYRIAAGEAVAVAAGSEDEDDPPGADDVPFGVAYEDAHVIVVDKPAGVVVHPGAGQRSGTLAQALAGRAAGGPDPERAGVVHRLDRDTSGLLVISKSEEAYAGLTWMIRERLIERRYLALVAGHPDARSGTIDAALGRDRGRRTQMSTRTDRPRSAVTHFELRESLPRTTLLDVKLETGRTHQIRAHLAAIGHPVCGDERYGGGRCGLRLGLTRQFLHSRRVRFDHPVSGEQIVCESKPPADLHRALDAARREPVSGGPDGD
jgi:23S rRNA pseudouridine1911/1915/1917 synthase